MQRMIYCKETLMEKGKTNKIAISIGWKSHSKNGYLRSPNGRRSRKGNSYP